MFVILVYDISEKRVVRVFKLVRQYLHWRQKSVFDGDINQKELNELIERLKKIINEGEDYVIIYKFDMKARESIELGERRLDEFENIIF